MFPAEVASRLKLATNEQPVAPQPVPAARQLTDVLSELVPGQRIMAEIQALLPNGTYRAMVGQRDITLALPFSAKPGDSLELEVVEHEGKLTLAFVTNRQSNPSAASTPDSVPATLSKTGQLIGNLLGEITPEGKKAPPLLLNGNAPILSGAPTTGAEMAPLLQKALTESGMFYESHQARWVEGKLPTETLLHEPQGKYPGNPSSSTTNGTIANPTGNGPQNTPDSPKAILQEHAPLNSQGLASPIHPDLTPVVQQQLDALATQNYVWQGQVWPGQQMHWEISEEGQKDSSGLTEETTQWKTSLKLDLPSLGGIDATIRLRPGNKVEVSIAASTEGAVERLRADSDNLKNQLADSAGLALTQLLIKRDEVAG